MAVSRRVTSSEIAQKLNLSRTTVSLVLSGRAKSQRIAEGTAQRIMDMAREMRYRPNLAARQLTGKGSNAVGVLVTSEMMVDLRLIEAMELLAAERSLRFVVGHSVGSAEQVKDYIDDFRSRGVDGMFSFFHQHPVQGKVLLPELAEFENVVFYEMPAGLTGAAAEHVHYVSPDFPEAGRLGVRCLLDQGRRRIGLVLREPFFPYATARRAAYEAELAAAGLPVDPNLVWVITERTANRWTDRFTLDNALQAVDDLVVGQGVDGIVAVNDLFAAGLVAALRQRRRRVPEDVAVVGCDNEPYGEFLDPPLTTIDLRIDKIAEAMMSMMFDLLDGKTIPEAERARLITPELIVRR